MQIKKEALIGYSVLALFVAGAFVLEFVFQTREGALLTPDVIESSTDVDDQARIADKWNRYPVARKIVQPAGFINTQDGEPIAIESLIGKKVILLDIWTYSCINCLRTLPYLTAWHEAYEDQGLQIIGIHTPEFDFEKEIDNVQRAVEAGGIKYPVVLDNDRGTWNAYQNNYWPRKYLIDIDGFIVYDHIGEGGYDETEAKIQELLWERAAVLDIDVELLAATPMNVEELDLKNPRTPEVYLGAWRNSTLGNGEPLTEGNFEFVIPGTLNGDTPYLGGSWEIVQEFARNTQISARLVLPYRASKVFLVMAPGEKPVRARVLLDGQPIAEEDADQDVVFSDGDPYILIDEDIMYRIVETASGWGEHTLELIFDEVDLEVYAFTFG